MCWRMWVNQIDKSIVFIFRQKDQLSSDVMWSGVDKVSQSNARFNATDTLIVTVRSVTMPVRFGRVAIKRTGRPFATLVQLKDES